MPKYKFCIKCGKELATGATFCQYCGAEQTKLEDEILEVNENNSDEDISPKNTTPIEEDKNTESFRSIVSPTIRLIFGIIFIVVAAIALFQSFAVMTAYSIGGYSEGSASGAAGILVSLLMLVLGIIFIATRKNNSKGLKTAIYIIGALSAMMAFGISSAFSDMSIYGILIIAGAILCNLPLSTETIEDSTDHNNEDIEQSVSSADEIIKLKKLLDDGTITQEEFDAKKKQILGI